MAKIISGILTGLVILGLFLLPQAHGQISPGQPNLSAPGPIGGTTPSTGAFTALTINGVPVYAGHSLIGAQTFCSVGCTSTGGAYTPDAGTNLVIVEVQAPGGGSGPCNAATTATQVCATGGGGSGSYEEALLTTGFSGAVVTAPIGGAPGAAGGTASFGSIISCPGGFGIGAGTPIVPSTSYQAIGGGGGAPAACTLSGGTQIVQIAGVTGGVAFSGGVTANQTSSGQGGAAFYGLPFRGLITTTTVNAVSPTGYGAGATGGVSIASEPAFTGASGGQGIVIVYEYN
jgi:hypothetical protein